MEKRWITGEEILERWQGLDFELVDAFMDGWLIDGERMTLLPINKATGERMIDTCLVCVHATFEGMPGTYCFENDRINAGDGWNDGDCCEESVEPDVLAARLKGQYFSMKEVQKFEGFRFEIAGKIQSSQPENRAEFSPKDESISGAIKGEDSSSGLSADERRELLQLRSEKAKWDLSIQAALRIGLSLRDKHRVTKEEVWSALKANEIARGDLPDTTFLKIWKAIPEELRSVGGRPKKLAQGDETP